MSRLTEDQLDAILKQDDAELDPLLKENPQGDEQNADWWHRLEELMRQQALRRKEQYGIEPTFWKHWLLNRHFGRKSDWKKWG